MSRFVVPQSVFSLHEVNPFALIHQAKHRCHGLGASRVVFVVQGFFALESGEAALPPHTKSWRSRSVYC